MRSFYFVAHMDQTVRIRYSSKVILPFDILFGLSCEVSTFLICSQLTITILIRPNNV